MSSSSSCSEDIRLSISVDELRSLLRADTEEVVRAELRDLTAALGRMANAAKDAGRAPPARRLDDEGRFCDLSVPARAAVTAPLLPAKANGLTGDPLESEDDDAVSDRKIDLQRKFTKEYGLLEIDNKKSFADRGKDLCPNIGGANGLVSRLLQAADWLMSLEEPYRTGTLADCVQGNAFQAFFVGVIVANAAFMAYKVNGDMLSLGTSEAGDPEWMEGVDMAFLLLYCAELLCKLSLHRLYYFWNEDMAWNWLDFVLILQGLADAFAAGGGGGNTWMRTFRLLRVAKVLRILRVIKFFTQLYMIVGAIMGSMMHLFWSMLMFAIVFFMFSLFIMSNVLTYLQELDSVDNEESKAIMEYFGSFSLSMRTLLLTVSGGSSWDEFYFVLAPISIAQNVFLFFVAFSQIALLNIVTGIFVENALKLSQPDFHQQAEEQFAEEREYAIELKKMVEGNDENQDGFIDRKEFDALVQSGKLMSAFKFLNIDPSWSRKHMSSLYDSISEQTANEPGYAMGKIHSAALVERIMALRGYARSTEIMDLHDMVVQMKRRQEQIAREIHGDASNSLAVHSRRASGAQR